MLREADLLAALQSDPADDLAWLALADCLEENGEADRAELVRLREWLREADVKDPERPAREARLGELLIAGVRPSVPLRTVTIEGKRAMTLALVPPGRFWMGCVSADPDSERIERPRHKVTLTRPFWIGVTPVTRAQWQAVMSPHSGAGPRPAHPVQDVLLAECLKFCKALGKKTGTAVRLPTEAEWEYACRAGTCGSVYLGDLTTRELAAWHTGNSRGHTHPVGKKVPNAWGLYDMLGNIWEWCADGKRTYTARVATDPAGPGEGRRIVKGGAWRSAPGRCRAPTRYAEEPSRRCDDQGFRVVMDWG